MNIEITAKKDGQEIPLSDISTATFEKLKAEKPCEKPKELRRGDYGVRHDNMPWLKMFGKVYWLDGLKGGTEEDISSYPDSHFEDSQIGNLVDDLKRNSKDLEEFEVDGQYNGADGKTFQCNYNNHNNKLWMTIQTSSSYFAIEQAQELHQKLGQMIATAKRRKAKKDDC